MQSDIKRLTFNGIGWSFIEKIAGYLIQFIFTILLARMLSPEEFGLIGLMLVFTSISQVFIDSGFTQTLIRNKELNSKDYSSVFYLNVVIGIFIYLLLFIFSEKIAYFYEEERLKNICRVMFLSIVVNSFSIVPNSLVQKDMNFKILAQRTLLANIASGLIALVFAFWGFGIWALVFQILFGNVIKTILLWVFVAWRPMLFFSFQSIKSLYKFSINVMLSSLLDTIVSNVHLLIIGKYYNRIQLGFYTQAYNLQSIPSNALVAVIRGVSFPAMSKIQEDPKKLINYFSKLQSLTFFFVFNAFLLLSILSEEIVMILLGSKWISSIDYLRLTCFVGAFLPIYNLGMNVLLVYGEGKKFLITNVIKRVVTVSLMLATIGFGIKVLIYGQIAAVLINSFITMKATSLVIQLSVFEQIIKLYKTVIIGGIGYLIILGLKDLFQFDQITNGVIKLLLFSGIVFVSTILIKHEIISFIKKQKNEQIITKDKQRY